MSQRSKILPWRVVLVGVGGRGVWAVHLAAADPRLQVVALVDKDQRALADARDYLKLSEGAVFSDLEDAIRETSPEVALICTPMVTHTALCRVAFSHRLHVLLEKGMTFHWDEAQELVARAGEAGVCFCVAQNYRYRAPILAISEILADSGHPDHPGEVNLVECHHRRFRPDPRTSDYPFAMVWDMSCHHMDFLLQWLGPLERVNARTFKAPWSRYSHDPNISAWLKFQSGAVVNYSLTHDALLTEFDLILQGERGALRHGSEDHKVSFYPRPGKALQSGAVRSCVVAEQPRDVELVLEDFIGYVEGGEEPGISGRFNLPTMEACALLVKSSTEKREVQPGDLAPAVPKDELLR